MANDNGSLSHTKWNCKYHIVFAPKYRRQVVYRQIKADIGRIIRQLCEMKKVEIIEAEACPDHIHMLVSIPPNISVSQFVGYLKGKSSLMIFDRHANLKYKYGIRHFWCRGYYVDTVGRNKKRIAEYIRHQLADESVFSPADALKIMQTGAADLVNIKLMKCGGITNALRIAAAAEVYGVECMIGCMLEAKISVNAAVELACAKKIITRIDLDGPVLCSEDHILGGAVFDEKNITVSDAPGLGIQGFVPGKVQYLG